MSQLVVSVARISRASMRSTERWEMQDASKCACMRNVCMSPPRYETNTL